MLTSDTSTMSALRALEQKYPRAFPRNAIRIKPISAGAEATILNEAESLGFDQKTINAAIKVQKSRRPYVASLTTSESYVDLDGHDDGVIDASVRDEARRWLLEYSIEACTTKLESKTTDDETAARIVTILERDCYDFSEQSAFLIGVRKALPALDLREKWRDVAVAIHHARPNSASSENLIRATFLLSVTKMNCALLEGEFVAASECLSDIENERKAWLSVDGFFPNFFYADYEVKAYAHIIVGIEKFSIQDFQGAREEFEQWMLACSELQGVYNSRYDSIEACFSISRALEKAKDGNALRWRGWSRVDSTISDPKKNIWHTLWILWSKIQFIMPLLDEARELTQLEEEIVAAALHKASENWQLLLPNFPLSGRDRQKNRPVEILPPSFLDAQSAIRDSFDSWQFVLETLLRNILLLKVDFELKRRGAIPPLEEDEDCANLQLLADETLIELVQGYFAKKSKSQEDLFRKSVKFWRDASLEIQKGKVFDALQAYKRFVEGMRGLPLVVKVISATTSKSVNSTTAGGTKMIECQRLWGAPEVDLRLATPTNLKAGQFAYLQPGMNKFRGRELDLILRGDPVFHARQPEWMELFHDWASGRGLAVPGKFLKWCRQLTQDTLPYALRLLGGLEYFDNERLRETWGTLLTENLPERFLRSDTKFVGLGRAAKSGPHQVYFVKQAISSNASLNSIIDTKAAFLAQAELPELANHDAPIILVDDIIGSGQQAITFIDELISRFPEFAERDLAYCTVAGFEAGLRRVETQAKPLRGDVYTGYELREQQRAFAKDNPIWYSENDRKRAKSWATEIGRSLTGSEEHALGWENTEGLVCFSYNIPNNTLPLFWHTGQPENRWSNLFDRF